MARAIGALERLGWGPAFTEQFAQQIDVEALTATPPVLVVAVHRRASPCMAVHRSGLQIADDGINETILPGPDATVGDWLPVALSSTRRVFANCS